MIDTLVRLAEDTPVPIPTSTVDPDLVSPGPLGFAAMVVFVGLVIVLLFDMQRRIRRVRYREEVRAELDAEEAAAGAADISPDKGDGETDAVDAEPESDSGGSSPTSSA